MENGAHSPDSPESNQECSGERELFATELMRLKHRGCCVLVTGRVSERVRAAQSRQLFGDIGEPRQRVLTLTDATPTETCRYLPDGITPSQPNVTVLDHTSRVRDSSSTPARTHTNTHSHTQPLADTTHPEDGCESNSNIDINTDTDTDIDIDTLSAAITAVVPDDCADPGEIRLGVATLGTLIGTDGLSATRGFVRTVRAEVVAANGMGHVHLPGSPDTETLDALRPVIDIHIELRESQPRVPEHRWHLLETGCSTDWLPM